MKRIIFKLLLFINYTLLIIYIGLEINIQMPCSISKIVSLFLSSLMLIDATYVSSCNIRDNKAISLFCGLLALDGWYMLLSVSDNAAADIVFYALSPVIWCIFINFILMFLFQGSGYKFKKAANLCLTGTCICSLVGILISDNVFALLYDIQFLLSWLCFVFVVAYHRKRTAFVLKAEWKSILSSLVVIIILFIAYCLTTMGIKGNLSNFGVYIPALLFSMSIHSIILKEHHSFPLSAIFSRFQLMLILLFGVAVCALITMTLGISWLSFLLMLDAMFVFIYVCNIILDFNLRQGRGNMVMESKYNAALAQLQQEERIYLEFSNFLHDNILQDLLSIKNMMHKSARPDIQKIITETLDSMNIYIREQMQNYHPVLLSKLTIKENYQNLLAYIAQLFPERHVGIVFNCPDSLFLVPPYDIFIYRLMKELVTNVYKHSTGEKAWITLTQDNGMIVLCVKDNGSADTDSLTSVDSSKHRGLALSTDRVHSMDGTVSITQNFLHGICVCISLPMKGDASYQYFISR
ncbi:ATP-binding protein [bacterium 1XD42-54]|nr:ATP-binding protein [bacterium 1XD42-54]